MAHITANNIDIYYEIKGKGTPIVLIAGFSCDHTFWSGAVDDLSKTHQVLVFDNRGIGQTKAPDTPFTVDTMADDVIALLHELHIEKPVIVGQSMGSAMAQSIGKRYSDVAQKLILINTFTHVEKAPEMAFALTGELQRLNVAMRYRVQSIAPWVFSSTFLSQANQLENLVKLAEDNPYPQTLSGYEGQLQALRQFNSQSWLDTIKLPTLIIAAEEDIIAPMRTAQAVHQGIDNSKLLVIEGGHASPIEQTQKVNTAILTFAESIY